MRVSPVLSCHARLWSVRSAVFYGFLFLCRFASTPCVEAAQKHVGLRGTNISMGVHQMDGLSHKEWARFESRVAWLTEYEKNRSSAVIAGKALEWAVHTPERIRWMRENHFETLIELVDFRRAQRRRRLHRKRAKAQTERRRVERERERLGGDAWHAGGELAGSPQEGGAV